MNLLRSLTALWAILLSASATQLFVHTVSWNSGRAQAPDKLEEFVGIVDSKKPDVVGIAVEGSGFHSYENHTKPACLKRFPAVLQSYTKVSTKFTDNMGLAVYILKKHNSSLAPSPEAVTENLTEHSTSGGIAITFTLYQKRFTFITSRMSDEDAKKSDLKHAYYAKLDKSKGENPSDFLFWFGDFNFRVTCTAKEAKNFIIKNNTDGLFAYDQFKAAQEKGLFPGWNEEKINFKPNYKYKRGKNKYNWSENPSWTSRVFYKSGTKKIIEPVTYNVLRKYKQSDHKPVVGQFYINA